MDKNINEKGRFYFVDEGGDGTLFSKRGSVIVNSPGCSRFFILGLLDVRNPNELNNQLNNLRQKILNDPYYQSVPSVKIENTKTAVAFHAKDDLPEIRKEVFSILRNFSDLDFRAVVTDKKRVLEYVRQQNSRRPEYRYNPNDLYDYLVRRLFKNHLHKDNFYEIVFASRGNSDRTKALRTALDTARKRFDLYNKIESKSSINVISAYSKNEPCLQAVDYFVWATQRLFEKQEDRYIAYLWPMIKLIIDMDDTRRNDYGVYYSQNKPISREAIIWRNNLNKTPEDIG
jgi:hypothetical protein